MNKDPKGTESTERDTEKNAQETGSVVQAEAADLLAERDALSAERDEWKARALAAEPEAARAKSLEAELTRARADVLKLEGQQREAVAAWLVERNGRSTEKQRADSAEQERDAARSELVLAKMARDVAGRQLAAEQAKTEALEAQIADLSAQVVAGLRREAQLRGDVAAVGTMGFIGTLLAGALGHSSGRDQGYEHGHLNGQRAAIRRLRG